jgi:hypothetical protein
VSRPEIGLHKKVNLWTLKNKPLYATMNSPHLTILPILLLNVLFAAGQIKSHYTPYEYSADTAKTICISEYQRDSIKYEILFYRDILEETKRTYLISQKTKFVDTVISNTDSLVINYYTIDANVF